MDEGTDEIVATYRVPTAPGLENRAEQMAIAMTVGTWTDVPAVTQERLLRHRGRVVDVVEEGESSRIRIAYPEGNLPAQLSAVLTVVFGKLSLDGAIRLEQVRLPTSFLATLPGPRYGVPGLRERLGVSDRPLLMSIVKSQNGQSLEDWGEALYDQWAGGADLVKDDEIFFADQDAPALRRAERARGIAERVEAETGRRPLYALNLTAAGPDLPREAERLMAAGAEAFLVAPYTVGLDTLAAVACLNPSPILLAHPAFSGAFINVPGGGVAPAVALGELIRAAGADVGIYPSAYGAGGSVAIPEEEARAITRALTRPDARKMVWPAPSAGIHPGLVPALVRDVGPNVIVNADGAIHGHPAGTRAGAAAFRQALDRFLGRGGPVPDELAQALARWGGAA